MGDDTTLVLGRHRGRDQLDWFLGNNMDQFSLSRNLSINDVANGVTHDAKLVTTGY